MKLMKREPTEAMAEEGLMELFDDTHTAKSIWQRMFDASPELTVDMEPVAYIVQDNYDELQTSDCSGMPVYSATQLATLQAENERLTEERDELLPVLRLAGAYLVTGTKIDNDVRALLAKHEGEKHD